MNKYNAILEKYPLLFSNPDNLQTPFALFGFECDEGWYDIINNMCNAMYSGFSSANFMLQETEKRIAEFPDREDLFELKKEYEKRLAKEKKRLPLVAQIKEKFGTLRVYLEGGSNTPRGIAEMAELMSETTCEICGNKGKTYTLGWHKTLCYEHAIERYTKSAVDKHNQEEL